MHTTRLVRARTHNLQDVSVELRDGGAELLGRRVGLRQVEPRFDTLYAERQRRSWRLERAKDPAVY
ncbi:MAG: hypothetical protein ACT4TC_07265 [Myxococcaceae bacterium]